MSFRSLMSSQMVTIPKRLAAGAQDDVRDELGRKDAAVLAHVEPLALPGTQVPHLVHGEGPGELGGHQAPSFLAHQLVRLVAVEDVLGRVGEEDRAVGARDGDSDGETVHGLAQGDESLLGLAVGRARLRLPELPLDCRRQPLEVRLHDVVVGPRPHGLHRDFLADGARHEDERDVDAAAAQDGEGVEAGERRQREVGDHDVP